MENKILVNPKILIADDEEITVNVVKRFFHIKGFQSIHAYNGMEALTKEEEFRPDLVILDVNMPVIDGFEACRIIKQKRNGTNYIPVIFISGIPKEESVITGFQIGADDYVRKPFELLELLSRVNNLLKIKNLITNLESLGNVVSSMVKSIEARDSYTAGHSYSVANISMDIGRMLELPEKEIEILRMGSLLHDIGKIGVPDQILNKTGKLLVEEFNRIKEHPVKGEEICKNLRLDSRTIDIIRHHHEKLDGSGYPDKLRGNEIDKLVRIVTVADIFDALTTKRPYHPAINNQNAFYILKQEGQKEKLDINIINYIEILVQKNSI